MRFLTAVALALVMLWVPVDGVAQQSALQDDPLRGTSRVFSRVLLSMTESIPEERVAEFEEEIQDAFDLGLLRAGIELNQQDPERLGPVLLNCEALVLLAAGIPGTSVPYMLVTSGVYLEEIMPAEARLDPVPPGTNFWLVQTWKGLRDLRYQPLPDFSGTEIGEFCADQFLTAWRRANN